MKIELDRSRCQGHMCCAGLAPELFASTDDDFRPVLLHNEVDGEMCVLAEVAAAGCPERAILLSAVQPTVGRETRRIRDETPRGANG